MIKGIDLRTIQKTKIYFDKNGQTLNFLDNINKLNIFVGANNSGKSRFLRRILSNPNCHLYTDELTQATIIDAKRHLHSIYRRLCSGYKWSLPNGLKEVEELDEVSYTMYLYNVIDSFDKGDNTELINFKDDLNQVLMDFWVSPDKQDAPKYIKKYIPILRGIENFDNYFTKQDEIFNSISVNFDQRKALDKYIDNSKRIYINKISDVYDMEENIIFTGEDIYEDISKKLLGDQYSRKLIYDFQEFIKKYFYNGKTFEITPNLEEKVVYVKIGEIEHPLHNLGDGIKQMIVILYIVFMNKDNNCVFCIEEPEINLHPGFQRKLIEILSSNIFPKHQYFVSTHSNHIIDSSLDFSNISIYKFINNEDDTFSIINTSEKDIDLLDQLGVRNSSIFLSNCTIWVEGISDKILIKKYLDFYLKKQNLENKFREDIDYSFVEYDGNNIVHWNFESQEVFDKIKASGITNRVFVIVDNDNNANADRKEYLKSIFNDRLYILSVREIENTLSKKVLDSMLLNKGGNRILDYEESDYQNESIYMGTFIEEHYANIKKWKSEKTGTINNKLEFSKLAIQYINDYDDLSLEAKNICEKLLLFIDESNKDKTTKKDEN